MNSKQKALRYLLMDIDSKLLAMALLAGPPSAPSLSFQLLDGDAEEVAAAGMIQAIPQEDFLPMQLGRVVRYRGNIVEMEPLRRLSDDARENLRMPVSFDTFVYFREGGRAPAKAADLSCGGIAFYTQASFQIREQFEIVIPITEEGPLVLDAQILREQQSGHTRMYAAKFINMLHDQEARVREAVFHIQVLGRVLVPAGMRKGHAEAVTT